MVDAVQQTELSASESKALEIIAIGGYSLFIGWFLLSAFDLLPYYPLGLEGCYRLFPTTSLFAGMALFTLVFRVTLGKLDCEYTDLRLVCAAAAACVLLMACIALAWAGMVAPLPLLCACALLAGGSVSYLFFAWDDFGGRFKPGLYARYLAAAICLGNGFFLFALFFMQPGARCSIALGLIVLSAVLLMMVNRLSHAEGVCCTLASEAENPPQSSVKLDKRIRVLFLIFGVSFGVAWSLVLNSWLDHLYGVSLLAIIMALLLILVVRKDAVIHDHYVTLLIRSCVAALGVSFLFMAFAEGVPFLVFASIVCAAWQIYWIVDSSLLIRHATKHGFSIPRHMATGKMSHNVGLFAGMVLGLVCSSLLGSHAATGLCITMTAMMVLFGMVLFPFENRVSPNQPDLAEEVQPSSSQGVLSLDMQEACNRVVALYGLSQREGEILQLLVKGRSNRVISEVLFISENTAKTHIYNIYKKMGIHSRQDLLDIVETISS